MDELIRWTITTIVGILGLLVGRSWEKHDHNREKDRELLKELLELLPSGGDTISFLREQDFGGDFERKYIRVLDRLWLERKRPDFFFLDKRLETLRVQLFQELGDFHRLIGKETFVNDFDQDYAQIPKTQEVRVDSMKHLIGPDRSWANISSREQEEIILQAATIANEWEEKRQQVSNGLNTAANKFIDTYDKLIRRSREIL